MNHLPTFNAWHEPWIYALDLQGMSRLLSINDVLRNAHQLRSLSDSAPIIVGGTHRLLTAIVQFIEQPQVLEDVGRVYEQGHFEQAKLDTFTENYAQRFDIFDPPLPFLQTSDVALDALARSGKTKDAKNSIVSTSIAAMFADIPSASNRTHYYHTIDDQHALCPACCTAGLVIASAFAQNAGRGWRASITGDPPLYIFPVGDNLFQSLALSLMSNEYQPSVRSKTQYDQTVAPWTRDGIIPKEGKVNNTGYIDSLTFAARRVRLFPEAGSINCTRCGKATNTVVKAMFWESGFYRDGDAPRWQDPFVGFYIGSDKQPKALKINKGKALWREYSTLFVSDTSLMPTSVQQIGALSEQDILPKRNRIYFRCIGMKTDGKAKVLEWLDESLEVPPPLLSNPSYANVVREGLDKAKLCERAMSFAFRSHVKQSGVGRSKNEPLVAIKERMQDRFWQQLAPQFRDFVAQTVSREEIEVLRKDWEKTIVDIAKECLNEALKQRGDSSDLLQSHAEALNHFGSMIAKYRKDGWK